MGKYKYKRFRHRYQIRILTLLGRNDPAVLSKDRDKIHCRISYRNLPGPGKPNETKDDEAMHDNADDIASEGTMRASDEDEYNPTNVVRPDEETDNTDYEAVSWTWGEEPNNESILVQDKGDWKTIDVRSNLTKVLVQLRREELSRNLWVDAVCIEQSLDSEKSQQVAMMAHIYGNATNVCIWLGDAYDNSDLALDFICNTVSDLGGFGEITGTTKFSEQWKALGALMNRPWFGRRWVVQEISHAKAATLHCGTKAAAWKDFEMAVSLFKRSANQIAKIFHSSEEADDDPEFFGNVQAMGATRLVGSKNKLFLRDDANQIVEYKYRLSDLVIELASFEAQSPHDMIYAVLSLAQDTHHRTRATEDPSEQLSKASSNNKKRPFRATESNMPSDASQQDNNASEDLRTKKAKTDAGEDAPEFTVRQKGLAKMLLNELRSEVRAAKKRKHKVFEVDYKQDFFQVCRQFLDFTFEDTKRTNNLDILCKPWAPMVRHSRLPSWIPSIAYAPFETRPAQFAPGGEQIARKNHDSLVLPSATANSGPTAYNACRSQRATSWRFGDTNNAEMQSSLFLFGFVIDTIGEIETFSQLGNIPKEWFDLAGWQPWDERGKRIPHMAPPEQLWKTLVADRGPDGAPTEIYYSKAFEYAIDYSTPTTGLETTNLTRRSNPILVEFLKRMEAVVWNRRLFKSAQHNLLGLAPKLAKENDVICILNGCSVPVVLRPRESHSGKPYHEFVGECYLHTMMDGRAIDIQEAYDIPTQEFELR